MPSTFKAMPYSSSTPSTPEQKKYGSKRSLHPHPSTTPAGPPPRSINSFTPAGPPPASVTGSSIFGTGNEPSSFRSKLENSKPRQKAQNGSTWTLPDFSSSGMSSVENAYQRVSARKTSRLAQSHVQPIMDDKEGDEDDAVDDADYVDEEEESSDDQDMSGEANLPRMRRSIRGTPERNSSGAEQLNRSSHGPEISMQDFTSHDSLISSFDQGSSRQQSKIPSARPKGERRGYLKPPMKSDSGFAKVIRNFAKQLGIANLLEPDHVILQTENLVVKFQQGREDPSHNSTEMQDDRLSETVRATVPEALSKLWQSCCNPDRRTKPDPTIGPHPHESYFTKATYLSNLLLKLHHPPASQRVQALAAPRNLKSSLFSKSISAISALPRSQPYPEVLVNWLAADHPIDDLTLGRIYSESTRSVDFWPMFHKFILRGQVKQALRLLSSADFSKAETAQRDGVSPSEGYSKSQLSHVKIAIQLAIQLLQSCPALADGDWQVVGNDWRLFRHRVEQAQLDLTRLAEGNEGDRDEGPMYLEAKNFGMSKPSDSMRQSFRRAESRVPWTIYQQLKTAYEIILGGVSEIISCSDDWVEATMSLTIWWDGSDDDVDEVPVGSISDLRRSLNQSTMRSQRSGPRGVDLNATTAYLRRLTLAFQHATDSVHHINPMDPVEVGVASVFENNVEGVLDLLRSWSLPVATATIEIATDGGWYEPEATGLTQINGFNASDLMVLSYGQPQLQQPSITKDAFLEDYANILFERESIDTGGDPIEGWELAVEILMRLSDTNAANAAVEDILGKLSVESDDRVTRMLEFCHNAGLDEQASKCSEKYADFLSRTSHRYGEVLVQYATSHSRAKLKHVFSLLMSHSLVQSRAYPPSSSVDDVLTELLGSPREAYYSLSKNMDSAGACLMQEELSGYATLRTFYDMRDGEGGGAELSSGERKRQAGKALVSLVESARGSIRGGLFDEEYVSIVPVDNLLVLLGEALVFIASPDDGITALGGDDEYLGFDVQQIIVLLGAIEDLQTVHPRIRQRCEDCLDACLANHRRSGRGGQRLRDTRDVLRKSLSEATAGSGSGTSGSFEMLGGSDVVMGEDDPEESGSQGGSGVLVRREEGEVKRGWDWREGMGESMGGEEIIGMLRLGLARSVARVWLE